MGKGSANLTGDWDGTFSYPDVPEAGPTMPFLATLTDEGGVLRGTIIEPHEFRSGTANSVILGQRIGRSIHFAKDYQGAGPEYGETVLYFGTLSEDGEVVAGEWQIDHWRGPFEMRRGQSADTDVAIKAQAEVTI